MDGHTFVRLIRAFHVAMHSAQGELNALDSALGDGDHGSALAIAFADAADTTATLTDPLPASVLAVTAQSLLNRMGGASGALYGTVFLQLSAACKGHDEVTLREWQAGLHAGLESVQARGKAAPGDKTLVDALAPAVAAVAAADSLSNAFAAAAAAAQAGAASTAEMVAKFGRAKFVGERARGHVDAGARSMAVLFTALHHFWEGAHDQA